MPDRETPGKIDIHCNIPIIIESFLDISPKCLFLLEKKFTNK